MTKRLLACMCAVLLACWCAACGTQEETTPEPIEDVAQDEAIEPRALDDYSWEELSAISEEIASAKDDTAGREVATHYGLIDEDGRLSAQTKQIVLNDARALDVRLAGIRHDDKADGTGRAGLTFMTVGAWDIRPMNEEARIDGGWQGSDLRAWLTDEAKAMLDDDLADALVAVRKRTNNVGLTDRIEDVTESSDELWLFSVHEVCGDVSWDMDEFHQMRGYQDIDGMLNAEGGQYEVFANADVTCTSDPNGFLSLADSTGTSPWWYRSVYPFDWTEYDNTGAEGYFYQVRDSGYPESLGAANKPASVVVGFCV